MKRRAGAGGCAVIAKFYQIALGCLLAACLLLVLGLDATLGRLNTARANLQAAQTANAALTATIGKKDIQIFALQASGQGCEEARAEDAAAAATRRAILEQGGGAQKAVAAPAAPQGAALPQIIARQSTFESQSVREHQSPAESQRAEAAVPPPNNQAQEQARVRKAVADYLNRPL